LIRKMKHSDLASAIRLLATYNMAPQPGRPDAERSEINVNNSYVAEDGQRIVGVASYIVHSGHLAETASLAVHADYHGKGIGVLLQQARLDEMRGLGIRKVRTEADRPETIRWYIEKFGYRKVGTNPKKHHFGLADVDEWTVLELELT